MEDYPEIGATHTHRTDDAEPRGKAAGKTDQQHTKNPKWQSDACRVHSKRTEGFFIIINFTEKYPTCVRICRPGYFVRVTRPYTHTYTHTHTHTDSLTFDALLPLLSLLSLSLLSRFLLLLFNSTLPDQHRSKRKLFSARSTGRGD